MTRIAVIVGSAALICGALPACAAGLGWKVLSYQSVKAPEICFYGSANVYRANGHLSVWIKCLAKEDLENAVKADAADSFSDIAAEKIAHDYVPPIARIAALPGDQIVDAVMNEELANNGNIRPLVTALREIDCSKRRVRDRSIIKPVDGQLLSSDTPLDWHPLPSAGELASLFRSFYAHSPAQSAITGDPPCSGSLLQNSTDIGGNVPQGSHGNRDLFHRHRRFVRPG
jgi:hypothetical protein